MTTTARAEPLPAAAFRSGSGCPDWLGLGMIWGSSFLLIKIGVSALAPAYVALGRVLSGAIVLVVLLAITRQRLPRDVSLWAHNAVVAGLGIAAPVHLVLVRARRRSPRCWRGSGTPPRP